MPASSQRCEIVAFWPYNTLLRSPNFYSSIIIFFVENYPHNVHGPVLSIQPWTLAQLTEKKLLLSY